MAPQKPTSSNPLLRDPKARPSRQRPSSSRYKKNALVERWNQVQKQLNSWGLGFSGKVILTLVLIGLISKIFQKIF